MIRIPLLRHDSLFKVVWNAVQVAAISGLSMILSYRLTFHQQGDDWVYWLLVALLAGDVAINSNAAIKRRLVVLNNRPGIIRHYLRTWFWVDLAAAVPWEALLGGGGFLVRLLPLVKLVKVPVLVNSIRDTLKLNPSVIRLVSFALWLVQAVHYIALGWVFIGASEAQRPSLDQYIRALYWCITTVATIGYGDYYPSHEHNLQILYTISVEIFGVLMYAYIIGNVVGVVSNLDQARAAFMKRIEEIGAFMRTRKVPPALQEKVYDYYAYLWETRNSSSPTAVLDELPHSLSLEIRLFINRGILQKVDLFRQAGEVFIREVVQALQPIIFLPGDYIIRQGEHGDCMYFLSTGAAEVQVNAARVAVLGAGSPFGETALITAEKRMASIRALTYCDVYLLTKDVFDALRRKYPEFDAQVREIVAARQKDTQSKTTTPAAGPQD
jgi:voltage-gated potassium channel